MHNTGNFSTLSPPFSGIVTLCHVHYGVCVVGEMCQHLKIRPFHISPPAPPAPLAEDSQRLLDSEDDDGSLVP